MTIDQIIQRKQEIYNCAKVFRKYANTLMGQLATDFNFSRDKGSFIPREVYIHKYNNKGLFKGQWIYYFHGSEVRFEHLETGQILELVIINQPEFGFLDGFFFYNYMNTTTQFKDLARWFENHMNVWTAIALPSASPGPCALCYHEAKPKPEY